MWPLYLKPNKEHKVLRASMVQYFHVLQLWCSWALHCSSSWAAASQWWVLWVHAPELDFRRREAGCPLLGPYYFICRPDHRRPVLSNVSRIRGCQSQAFDAKMACGGKFATLTCSTRAFLLHCNAIYFSLHFWGFLWSGAFDGIWLGKSKNQIIINNL